ncbi:MAG: hypothetical protein AAFX92_10025 [Pseudomonadota bacterium]
MGSMPGAEGDDVAGAQLAGVGRHPAFYDRIALASPNASMSPA